MELGPLWAVAKQLEARRSAGETIVAKDTDRLYEIHKSFDRLEPSNKA